MKNLITVSNFEFKFQWIDRLSFLSRTVLPILHFEKCSKTLMNFKIQDFSPVPNITPGFGQFGNVFQISFEFYVLMGEKNEIDSVQLRQLSFLKTWQFLHCWH